MIAEVESAQGRELRHEALRGRSRACPTRCETGQRIDAVDGFVGGVASERGQLERAQGEVGALQFLKDAFSAPILPDAHRGVESSVNPEEGGAFQAESQSGSQTAGED